MKAYWHNKDLETNLGIILTLTSKLVLVWRPYQIIVPRNWLIILKEWLNHK